jgi:peptidoglycan/xylan/chitin deacetylase (PgdA/CDA1 family)
MSDRYVTLSFDNGPEPDVTPRVLDSLARAGIPASFFVIGKKLLAREGRALAERAHAEGHWIGNHTFTHGTPLGETTDPNIAALEIGRTEDLIGDLARPSPLFRPFGGGGHLDTRLLKPSVVDHLTRHAYTCVLWNVVPRDWVDPVDWVDRCIVECRAKPWSLVVLHDLPTGAMDHLDRFLDRMSSEGVTFRQDYPPECVPIRDGKIIAPIDGIVRPAA